MKYVFIINPHSGNNEHNQLKDKITKHFKGKKIIIEKTTAPKQATIIAKSYASNTTELIHMFACGGDGTIHEIVNGIAGCNHIILSIVPIGTGNDFIKSLDNYSKSDFLDLSKYDRPILMPCDLMLVNNEYAINTISLGFDVHVAKHVNTFRKKINIGGIIPYYLGMLASLIKPLNEKLNIQIDNMQPQIDNFTFAVFCNGKYYGGGYKPCPNALINDNFIDVCLIKNVKKHQIVRFAGKYKKGTHIEYDKQVSTYKANTIYIDTNDQPIDVNLDGEVRSIISPTIEIVGNAITLALPKR